MNWVTGDAYLYTSSVKVLVIFGLVLVVVAFWTYVERRVCGFMQNRLGPNRVGPLGLFQPVADGLKSFIKEETLPPFADKGIFLLAPAMAFIPALLTIAVVPMSSPLPTPWGLVSTQIADLPVGFLFILAISSLGVYGIALAGWASNSKYSMLGGLRAAAQLISYEIAMGMSLVALLVLSGNITLGAIVQQQQAASTWYVVPLFIAFFLFLVSAFAETNRLPFDMAEAESELVAGYHTEYSAMKFSMFYIAEYSNMLTASALIATLFLGGWDVPFTNWDNAAPWTLAKFFATFAAFWAKTLFWMFFFVWVRWTIPRFRFDQLMTLGWKVMLPIALAYIMVVATTVAILETTGVRTGPLYMWILGGVNAVLAVLLFWVLDRRRTIGGAAVASRRAWRAESQRLIAAEREAALERAAGGG